MEKRQLISRKLALPDATQLRQLIDTGQTNSQEVVQDYLKRLEIFNPQLNAATHIYKEEALRLSQSPKPGLLSGIPISIKETIGISGSTITCGSQTGIEMEQKEDSVVVEKLKAEGAIILARSNVPEYAMVMETDNLRFGRTNNPLNLACTPGGSSGGEGALVGSGCTVLGIGSDIGGSIRLPAAFCGVVGFKPASEAVDKTGTFPPKYGFSDTMLAIGPLARSVRDAKLVYNLIARQPLNDATAKPLSELRLFHPQSYKKTPREAEVSGAVGTAQALLKEAGMLKSTVDFEDAGQLYWDFNALIIHDFEPAIHDSLLHHGKGRYPLLKEAFLQLGGKPTIHPYLFQLLSFMQLLRPSARKVADGIARIERAREKYYNVLGEDGILLLPTVGLLAPKHGKMVAEMRKLSADTLKPTLFANILNLPAISLPAWRFQNSSSGLVPGVMLACRPGAEANLFAVAEWLEGKI